MTELQEKRIRTKIKTIKKELAADKRYWADFTMMVVGLGISNQAFT